VVFGVSAYFLALFSASEMTYIVSSGALNSTHSTLLSWHSFVYVMYGSTWLSSQFIEFTVLCVGFIAF